jgi:homoserine O-succinyltransferase
MDLRIAVLDMNDGHANQGMRCIREIIKHWSAYHRHNIQLDEFDVRQKNELPGLSYDIYISSGGPGSPLESVDEDWDKRFCKWIQAVEDYNKDLNHYPKKHVFFICHSYQLACRYYGLAKVSERKSMSFGVFPMHMTEEAYNEPVFDGLQDPFYAVDSRSYQVTEPDEAVIEQMGAQILAIEKDRPHVPYDRALMAIRFNDYFIGTQFHPEADAIGMSMHLQTEDKKQSVIENHGEAKWRSMIEQLNDPDKIMFTYSHILPNFLNIAAGAMIEAA